MPHRVSSSQLKAAVAKAREEARRHAAAVASAARGSAATLDAALATLAADETISGSWTFSSQTVVDDVLDFAEIADPGGPAAGYIRLFAANESGFGVLETENSAGRVFRINEDTFRIVRNTTGVTLNRGEIVYFSGSTGNKPNVALAKADASATMPAVAMVDVPIDDNAFGIVIVVGRVEDLNTVAFSEGDKLYVSATTAGALTATRPTHPDFAQVIGTVEVSHASNGAVLVNVAPSESGHESGTIENEFAIGDGTAGAKDLAFVNDTGRSKVSWTPTAVRTITLPDSTGTAATVIASTASTPDYEGQIAVTGGEAYIATGTASAADWKQITNP